MNKCFAVLILASILVVPSFAGTINFSGRAGLYTAPGATGASAMYGVAANYDITQNLALRGAVETSTYTVNNQTTTFTPVSVDLIYSQTVGGYLHPYAGVGASYNTTTVGGSSAQTSGAQAEAGVRFDLAGFSAGVEYRYFIPDLNKTNQTSSSYNAYATGAFSQSISF
jgi:hypothetical protein